MPGSDRDLDERAEAVRGSRVGCTEGVPILAETLHLRDGSPGPGHTS
jgi:hypothetical protein